METSGSGAAVTKKFRLKTGQGQTDRLAFYVQGKNGVSLSNSNFNLNQINEVCYDCTNDSHYTIIGSTGNAANCQSTHTTTDGTDISEGSSGTGGNGGGNVVTAAEQAAVTAEARRDDAEARATEATTARATAIARKNDIDNHAGTASTKMTAAETAKNQIQTKLNEANNASSNVNTLTALKNDASVLKGNAE